MKLQNKKIESAELDRKDRIMTEKYTISDLTTIREILQMAIAREKNSYQFYMKQTLMMKKFVFVWNLRDWLYQKIQVQWGRWILQ